MSLRQTSGRLMMILITIRSQKQADNIKPLPETAHGLQKACHLARYCDFSRCWHSIHHVLVASCVMLIVGCCFFLVFFCLGR